MKEINSVGIQMGQNVYSTFSALSNTVANVLAEFVDNAIQSYLDNKERLLSVNPEYKLHVDIKIDWPLDNDKTPSRIIITDNAAGIDENKYIDAFKPAIKPDNSSGLNEFGMGLKTAACWLGDVWSVSSKALGELEERKMQFDVNEVMINNLHSVPVVRTPKEDTEHYTVVTIINPNINAPHRKNAAKIKEELASIYRKFLRNNEIIITFCDETLEYRDPEILVAPFYLNPQSEPIVWKKEVDFAFGKYRARGFIALLKTMKSSQNGLVFLRRGRVILGSEVENGRYRSKTISGQTGSPRDKRIFGELELEGFNVSFNKNDIRDKDNLEALLSLLYDEIHQRDFDLVSQAQNYRDDITKKAVDKLVRKYNNKPRVEKKPVSINTTSSSAHTVESSANEDVILNKYDQQFIIDGVDYTLRVQFVQDSHSIDVFWLDTSMIEENILICNINVSHAFFLHFGEPKEEVVAIFKSLAVAKFATKKNAENGSSSDSSSKLLQHFNTFIEKTEV